MRILASAMFAIGTIAAAAPASAQTYSPNYPVCMHVYGDPTYYECAFTSIPQCKLTAAGRGADCVINPYFANADLPLAGPDHRRHRRAY
jgi:Protein of unknown function (DUF3551)